MMPVKATEQTNECLCEYIYIYIYDPGGGGIGALVVHGAQVE